MRQIEVNAPGWGHESKRLVAGLLVLAGLVACSRPAPEPQSPEPQSPAIGGQYALAGINRDGSEYTGEFEISALGDLLYWLEWQDPDGSYSGKGALVGDTLFAVWGSAEAQCSAVFLSVAEDGSLDGFWFQAQDRTPERGSMRAVPEAGDEQRGLGGRYEVTASVLGGSTFPPDLEVTALEDEFFRFRWAGEVAQDGIGDLDVDQIQVVSTAGEGQCGRSRMTLDAEGNLSGTWMINDEKFRTLGREKMTRR